MMKRRRRAFTLIELLVVILIIAILSGILFKIGALIGDKVHRSRCIYELEQIQNALAAYQAEYSSYPPSIGSPSQSMEYEFENTNFPFQLPAFAQTFMPVHNTPGQPGFFPDMGRDPGDPFGTDVSAWEPGLGYRYGLVSHLYERHVLHHNDYAAGQYGCWYDQDTGRDVRAKAEWAHYIDQIGPDGGGGRAHGPHPGMDASYVWSNSVHTIKDPWGRNYYYLCQPPHIRYRLWSVGPDGSDGTPDDVHGSRWSD